MFRLTIWSPLHYELIRQLKVKTLQVLLKHKILSSHHIEGNEGSFQLWNIICSARALEIQTLPLKNKSGLLTINFHSTPITHQIQFCPLLIITNLVLCLLSEKRWIRKAYSYRVIIRTITQDASKDLTRSHALYRMLYTDQ